MSLGGEDDFSGTLCNAALFGNKEMLESLLDSGLDPNVLNTKGNSPLHEAAHHGETECASLLLAHKGQCVGRAKLGYKLWWVTQSRIIRGGHVLLNTAFCIS